MIARTSWDANNALLINVRSGAFEWSVLWDEAKTCTPSHESIGGCALFIDATKALAETQHSRFKIIRREKGSRPQQENESVLENGRKKE